MIGLKFPAKCWINNQLVCKTVNLYNWQIWNTYIILFDKIATLEEALKIETRMSDFMDSDAAEHDKNLKAYARLHPAHKFNNNIDVNDLVDLICSK